MKSGNGLMAFERLWGAACDAGCETVRIAPDAFLLREGAVDTSLHLVRSGCLQAMLRRAGKEYALEAFMEGDAIASLDSFARGVPSTYAIQAVEESEILDIPGEVLERLLREQPVLARDVAEHHRRWIVQLTERIMELVSTSPQERYLRLSARRPELIERLPQYKIASMLGVTPETLSRIRNRLAKTARTAAGSPSVS
ncbi:MAG TPA: Crp/Fnr family transcriptional regulator [Fibrobacteria bacterium]|nr:Crp/Fnr family transcriptional regulator [Fibrobacteria bacterium]